MNAAWLECVPVEEGQGNRAPIVGNQVDGRRRIARNHGYFGRSGNETHKGMEIVALRNLARGRVADDGAEAIDGDRQAGHSLKHQMFGLMFGLLIDVEVPTVVFDRRLSHEAGRSAGNIQRADVGEFFEPGALRGEVQEPPGAARVRFTSRCQWEVELYIGRAVDDLGCSRALVAKRGRIDSEVLTAQIGIDRRNSGCHLDAFGPASQNDNRSIGIATREVISKVAANQAGAPGQQEHEVSASIDVFRIWFKISCSELRPI